MATTLTVVVVLAIITQASGLSCEKCTTEDEKNCPTLPSENCQPERTLCSCCEQCKVKLNEACGTNNNCESGLYCTVCQQGVAKIQLGFVNWYFIGYEGKCLPELEGATINASLVEWQMGEYKGNLGPCSNWVEAGRTTVTVHAGTVENLVGRTSVAPTERKTTDKNMAPTERKTTDKNMAPTDRSTTDKWIYVKPTDKVTAAGARLSGLWNFLIFTVLAVKFI